MKKPIIAMLSAATVGVVTLIRLYNSNNEPTKPTKYSSEWIKSLSDNEWESEREKVRLDYCNPNLDLSTRIHCERLLSLFDRIKSERDWAGKKPHGPAYHREHGWYLPNDD